MLQTGFKADGDLLRLPRTGESFQVTDLPKSSISQKLWYFSFTEVLLSGGPFNIHIFQREYTEAEKKKRKKDLSGVIE